MLTVFRSISLTELGEGGAHTVSWSISMSKRLLTTAAILPLLALSACGDTAEEAGDGSTDAASEQALNDQIMVD